MRDQKTPLAGRYRLGAALGRGGSGSVLRARDLLTGAEVAVKLLAPGVGVSAARVQLEVASLRALRIPGVVRLLDHGVDADGAWIVTDVIGGRPFPGSRAPARWERVRRPLRSLLETLGRIHAAGVVHRDLKPTNVLVDRAGDATVLDLGIARLGAALTPGLTAREGVFGSLRYMAPERHEGAGDAACDLFSVGVMLYEALTGEHPFCDDDDEAIMRRAMRRGLRVPLDARRPDLPPEACALCHALLRPRPEDRPRSAAEALATLPREAVSERPDAPPRDRLHHQPEDLGREAEAAAALERLRGETARGSKISGEISNELLRAARALCEEGALGSAARLLAEAIGACDDGRGDESAQGAAFALWLEAATQSHDTRMVDDVVYAMLRTGEGRFAEMVALGRAWHASLLWTSDALARVEVVPPQPSEGLEIARRNLRVSAARRRWAHEPEALRDVVSRESAEAEARGGPWRPRAAVWRGRLAYAEGRFEEAAWCYERGSEGEAWRSARLNATLNAASAWMESFDLARAVALAEGVRREAAACGHAFFEGRAEWIARTARDRAGEALTPDAALVAAGEAVAPELGVLLATTEATIAWRRGDRATVEAMAAVVRRARGVTGEAMATMVIEMLRGAMDAHAREPGRAVVQRALDAGLPRLALEALALGWGDGSAGEAERALARRLAAEVPKAQWGMRLGVLSVDECLRRVEREVATGSSR